MLQNLSLSQRSHMQHKCMHNIPYNLIFKSPQVFRHIGHQTKTETKTNVYTTIKDKLGHIFQTHKRLKIMLFIRTKHKM